MDHKYKIIKVIATGGMATIYKAEQVSLSRMVIIKKLHPHLASDIELVKRFEREAKILGRLNHKNIVEIIDFYEENGDYFIVLEYVDGKSLRGLLKEVGSLPLHIANFIILEIASGLSTAHKNGILHRDIKPGNIMIGNNGIVKISDFGLALALEGTEITEPGVTIGTPAYLPPELIKGKKATPKSDIYSLGILFYEIVTGRSPFEGANRYETINKILYKKLPPIHLKQDSENKDISMIITRMTRSNPKTRYGNINSIVRDLTPHTTANQHDLVKFLSAPEKSEYIAESQKRFSSGIFVYGALLLIVMFVSLAMMVGTKYMNSHNIPLHEVHYFPRNNDSLIEQPDTTTEANSIEVEDTVSHSITPKKDSTSAPMVLSELYGYLKPVAIPWAEIIIDDISHGNTPLSHPIKLTTGNHFIKLKHPNRKEFSQLISIAKDETLRIQITLQEVFGFLRINVNPWAEIYIDGEKKGITPIADPIRLTTGEHELELKKGESILWKKTIKIPLNDTLKQTINL